jgi:Cyclophilin type peptidyl-prolyl cis-trans isomerase/CLD
MRMKIRSLLAALASMFLAAAAQAANPVVVLETSKGDIKIELFEDKAPITVKNFLQYVDDKHYDGLVFHRWT